MAPALIDTALHSPRSGIHDVRRGSFPSLVTAFPCTELPACALLCHTLSTALQRGGRVSSSSFPLEATKDQRNQLSSLVAQLTTECSFYDTTLAFLGKFFRGKLRESTELTI